MVSFNLIRQWILQPGMDGTILIICSLLWLRTYPLTPLPSISVLFCFPDKYPVVVWSLMNNIPQLYNGKPVPCHQLQKAWLQPGNGPSGLLSLVWEQCGKAEGNRSDGWWSTFYPLHLVVCLLFFFTFVGGRSWEVDVKRDKNDIQIDHI